MEHYLSSSSLKSIAKGQLLGKYRAVIPAFLLHILCISAVNMAVSSLLPNDTVILVLVNIVLTYLVTVFLGIFSIGEAFIYLKAACNQMPHTNDLFWGFHNEPARILKVQAVRSAFSAILLLPANILSVFITPTLTPETLLNAGSTGNASVFLIYVLLLILGAGGSIFLGLVFSQSSYLLLDFPEYTAKQILLASMRLMKKNKGRLFYLELSFLPLFLLSLLSCGIALLWLMPYYYATLANFYLDLIRKSSSQHL